MVAAMYTVYLATNAVNGKRYVGVTGRGVTARSRRHLLLARLGQRECPRLYDAIRKYGEGAFRWNVLAVFDDKDVAYKHERVMVGYLSPEYNAAPGGVAGPVTFHKRKPVICLSDGRVFRSTLEAASVYGVHQSNIAGACRGETTTVAGRFFQFFDGPMSVDDCKAAIAVLTQTGIDRRSRGEIKVAAVVRERAGKEVVCLDDGAVFNSASAAARFYGATSDMVSRACRGHRGCRMVKGRCVAYVADVGQRMVA